MNRKLSILISLNLPDFYVKQIQDVSSDVKVQVSGDKKELITLIQDADILLAGTFSRELFLAAKRLKWIQSFFAGVLTVEQIINKESTLFTTYDSR